LRRLELPRKHAGASQKAAGPQEAARAKDGGRFPPQALGAWEADGTRQDGRTLPCARAAKIRRAPQSGRDGRIEKAARVEIARASWTLTAPSAPMI